jgi:hypothetical protein
MRSRGCCVSEAENKHGPSVDNIKYVSVVDGCSRTPKRGLLMRASMAVSRVSDPERG